MQGERGHVGPSRRKSTARPKSYPFEENSGAAEAPTCELPEDFLAAGDANPNPITTRSINNAAFIEFASSKSGLRGLADQAADFAVPDRSDRKPARTSDERRFGCSQPAKCPPLSSLL